MKQEVGLKDIINFLMTKTKTTPMAQKAGIMCIT